MSRRIMLPTALVLAVTICVSAWSEETTPETSAPESAPLFSETSSIDDYLDYALKHNPGLKASGAKHESAQARIKQASSLDDPELTFEYVFEQHDTQYEASLTQAIPGFGKLKLKKRTAAAQAEAAHHDHDAVRFMIFEDVTMAFYNYYYLGRAIAVTEENVKLLKDLEQVLLSRYKAGTARFSDVLKAQVEKERLVNDGKSLNDERAVKSARLSAMLDLPVDKVLPWPTSTASAQSVLPEGILLDMLGDLNPELKAADAEIEGLASSLKLAGKAYTPDFTIGAAYMVHPETDNGDTPTDTSVFAGITLPIWWGKYDAAVAESAATRDAAVFLRKRLRNNLQVDLKNAMFELRDAERQITLFADTLIPKAEQAFEVSKQGFVNGKVQFMDLVDAQRTLLEFKLMLERARADREIALGEIGCCVGRYDVTGTDTTE